MIQHLKPRNVGHTLNTFSVRRRCHATFLQAQRLTTRRSPCDFRRSLEDQLEGLPPCEFACSICNCVQRIGLYHLLSSFIIFYLYHFAGACHQEINYIYSYPHLDSQLWIQPFVDCPCTTEPNAEESFLLQNVLEVILIFWVVGGEKSVGEGVVFHMIY